MAVDESLQESDESFRSPPKYAVVSEQTGFPKDMAEACGIDSASEAIRKVKVALLFAHASKSRTQADLRVFFTPNN